jgi:antitoxin (DNA-binding transcriptional repressor) of toxin-antitoxin stability system
VSVTTVDVQELASRFAEVMSLAATGTEVIVTEGQIARARLVPLLPGQVRVAGLHPGAMSPTEDFDAPLPEEFWLGTS